MATTSRVAPARPAPLGIRTNTPSPPLPPPPSNSEIEQVIQMATSGRGPPGGRSPTGRDTRTQLFVGNLPYRVRWQDLKDLFRKAGTVLRADVSLGPDNRSRGYGTVLLATAEDAGRAVDMFNGYSWQTRTLEVRPDRLPPDFDALNPPTVANSGQYLSSAVHAVPYVPPTVAAPLVSTVPVSAPLVPPSVYSLRDEELTVRSRSPASGFTSDITFGMGVPLARTASTPVNTTSNGGSGRNLFVGNLPFHCQWQDLKDLFRKAGPIARADIAAGPDGRSRGFGTVVFMSEADAERAVDMFNGYEYQGRVLKVHHDKFTQSTAVAAHSTSPPPALPMNGSQTVSAISTMPNGLPPMHISLPPRTLNLASGPASPYEGFPPQRPPPQIAQGPLPVQAVSGAPAPPGPTAIPSRLTSFPSSTSLSSTTGNAPSSPRAAFPPTPGAAYPSSPPHNMTSHLPPTPTGHPAHPGPIALPPLHPGGFHPPLSPLMTHSLGLPPITPSMPSFTFVPHEATPPLHPSFLSPGVGPFSPALGSPGGWYSTVNPFLNPAPGAPLHMHPGRQDPTSYFDVAAPGTTGQPGGYFAFPQQPHPHALAQSETIHSDYDGHDANWITSSETSTVADGSYTTTTAVDLNVFRSLSISEGVEKRTQAASPSQSNSTAVSSNLALPQERHSIQRAKSTSPAEDTLLPTNNTTSDTNGTKMAYVNGDANEVCVLDDDLLDPLESPSVRRASWTEDATRRRGSDGFGLGFGFTTQGSGAK